MSLTDTLRELDDILHTSRREKRSLLNRAIERAAVLEERERQFAQLPGKWKATLRVLNVKPNEEVYLAMMGCVDDLSAILDAPEPSQ